CAMNMAFLSETLPLLLGVAGGAGLIVQQALNARLRAEIASDYWAGFASYVCGTLTMVVVLLVTRQPFIALERITAVPWWAWICGVFGALYIVAAIILVPRLGTTLTLSCIVLGQVVMALVFDQTGALGVPQHPITPLRILGVCLVAAGTIMVRR